MASHYAVHPDRVPQFGTVIHGICRVWDKASILNGTELTARTAVRRMMRHDADVRQHRNEHDKPVVAVINTAILFP